MEDLSQLTTILVKAVGVLFVLIVCIRICGLKSFSKMTSFDFAVTIAIGSILASTIISSSVKLTHGAVAIAVLFSLQYIISYFRRRSKSFNSVLNNSPVLLFKDGEFITKNLEKCDITKSDVIAKFREANAINIEQIQAVVFETTGDISVLHGSETMDEIMLDGIKL